jgi:hypothetical protein
MNLYYLIRLLIKILCINILIYQSIDLTNTYLSFPFEVKLGLNFDNRVQLPSITICLKRSKFWLKNVRSRESNHILYNCDGFSCVANQSIAGEKKDENNYYNFKQLFDITPNLSSIIGCSLSLKINNVNKYLNDCKSIGYIAEYMSKKNDYEKCFIYFNINQRFDRKYIYSMDDKSFIEFEFSQSNFEDFRISKDRPFLDSIYLSVHSSKSLFSSIIFHSREIEMEYISELIYTFSKKMVENLEWPYETDCENNNINSRGKRPIYLYEDCVNSCITNRILMTNDCIGYNRDYEMDLLLDKRTEFLCLNNDIKNTSWNDKNFRSKLLKKCSRICKQNCILEYYESGFDGRWVRLIIEEQMNAKIKIQYASKPIFEFRLYPDFTFVKFASNLGGIISMWFGFALFDIHKFIQHYIGFLAKIIKKILCLEIFLKLYICRKCMEKIIVIRDLISELKGKMKKINFKNLFKIICITCFTYQSIEMTLEYLSYKTVFNVEWHEYYSNGSFKSLPAITYCRPVYIMNDGFRCPYVGFCIPLKSQNDGNDIKKLFKNCKKVMKYGNSGDCQVAPKIYYESMDNQTLVSNYLNIIDLNDDDIGCRIDDIHECSESTDLITSHSELRKCYTFFSKLNEKFNSTIKVNSFKLKFGSIYREVNIQNGTRLIYIHDAKQLPSFTFSRLPSISKRIDPSISFSKTVFKRLPSPYDTNCFDYRGSVKSRAQCLNELMIKNFLKFKCLPKNHEQITFVIKNKSYAEFNYRFCRDSVVNSVEKISFSYCKIECEEEIYDITNEKSNYRWTDFNMTINHQRYMIVKYRPELEFIQFLANFGGLLGLWHGISFIDLKKLLIKISTKVYLKNIRVRQVSNHLAS